MGNRGGVKRPCVVLDTNMLMLLYEGVRVLEDIEEALESRPLFIVPSPVIGELERLSNEGTVKERRAARFALSLLEKIDDVEIVDVRLGEGENVDDALIRFALDTNCIIASNDRELRRKARRAGLIEAYYREAEDRIEVSGDHPGL